MVQSLKTKLTTKSIKWKKQSQKATNCVILCVENKQTTKIQRNS